MARKSSARARPAVDTIERSQAADATRRSQEADTARGSMPIDAAHRSQAVKKKPRPALDISRRGRALETAPRSPAIQSPSPAPASGGFTALLESAAKEILAVTYWFEPAQHPEPYPVTVRFTGRRANVEGKLQASDQFIQDETIERVVPGSGPISLTTKVHNVTPGEWIVTARVLETPRHAPGPREPGKEIAAGRTRWSMARLWKRWAPITGEHDHVKTCLPPFAKAPGVIPGVWGVLATLGMAVALALQFLVIALAHLKLDLAWLITLVAIGVGIVGAKIWFIVLHRRVHRVEGWCIQGFITGAVLAATLMLILLRVPAGVFLDATAPGLMVAMAVGRVGCFLAGCCGGPPTAARWGIWSSDQRVGARRVPTQLLESLLALILGLAALVAILVHGPAGGAFFVTALVAYTLGRQVIVRLRAEASTKWLEVAVTVALAVLVLVVEFAVFAH
jgi:phosphatidylglycerol:prolipoprotein diacylglycerol transferase